MGDRAVVLFRADGAIEPFAAYFHWAGQEGVEQIARTALTNHASLKYDPGYFAARFMGEACAANPGSTGVSLLAAPDADTLADPVKLADYSHGDAGVCIFDPVAGTLEWLAGTGYGARGGKSVTDLTAPA